MSKISLYTIAKEDMDFEVVPHDDNGMNGLVLKETKIKGTYMMIYEHHPTTVYLARYDPELEQQQDQHFVSLGIMRFHRFMSLAEVML